MESLLSKQKLERVLRFVDDHNKQFVALMQESLWMPEDVVRELGVTKGAVSQYRSGRTRPSLTVLRLFSAKTGIPLTLLPGEPQPKPRDQLQLDPLELEVLKSIRKLPPILRREHVQHISNVADKLAEIEAMAKGGKMNQAMDPNCETEAKFRVIDPTSLEPVPEAHGFGADPTVKKKQISERARQRAKKLSSELKSKIEELENQAKAEGPRVEQYEQDPIFLHPAKKPSKRKASRGSGGAPGSSSS